MACYISLISGKPKEFCKRYQMLSYCQGNQTLDQITNSILKIGKRLGLDPHRPSSSNVQKFLIFALDNDLHTVLSIQLA